MAVQLTICERPDHVDQILESYTFTIAHDGYLRTCSQLSSGCENATFAVDKVNESLKDLQCTLEKLPSLPRT